MALYFVQKGFRAIITCVDTQQLDARFSGKFYNKRFLAELPESVDPCGENGEFHSFVFDGPIFNEPVRFTKGDIVLRDNRYNYCDLLI